MKLLLYKRKYLVVINNIKNKIRIYINLVEMGF